MKRCGLILLLLSGYVMVCHLQSDQLVRQLYLVNLQKSWNDAQQYCRNEYIDLAIANSSALIQEAQNRVGNTEAWIGLSKSGWKWSRLSPYQSPSFSSWAPGEPGTGECVTISSDGSWTTRQCSEQHSFFCFKDLNQPVILMPNLMTWSDAQSYCRQTYTDLSSMIDSSVNTNVANMLASSTQAWIGLYRNDWTWSNSSTASNLSWAQGQPDDTQNCATIDGSTGYFHSHDCNDQRPFLCSTDVKPPASRSNVRSVTVQLRAGSADLNDPAVQESILQQVREKLVEQGIIEEVKLRWKTQPDGKIFHRQEETVPPGYCESV